MGHLQPATQSVLETRVLSILAGTTTSTAQRMAHSASELCWGDQALVRAKYKIVPYRAPILGGARLSHRPTAGNCLVQSATFCETAAGSFLPDGGKAS